MDEISVWEFQWAPTLGGECYGLPKTAQSERALRCSFNGHPPLGVNATDVGVGHVLRRLMEFQWAPTLGGECYDSSTRLSSRREASVSMGTHPWG